jgi:hypothetical protein
MLNLCALRPIRSPTKDTLEFITASTAASARSRHTACATVTATRKGRARHCFEHTDQEDGFELDIKQEGCALASPRCSLI